MSIDDTQRYNVYVRVQNRGCEPIGNVRARVASADARMIQTSWQEIGSELGAAAPLSVGEAVVLGPFAWDPDPGVSEHRCLLTIVNGDGDPASISGFGFIEDGYGGPVTNDNNVAQLNLQESENSGFVIENPFQLSAAGVGVEFDCNDYPLGEPGALVRLSAERDPQLEMAWTDVPNTTLAVTTDTLELEFHACRVRLPDALLPAQTVIPASVTLELPGGALGNFRVDFGQTLDGTLAGGMSFTAHGFPITP